MSKTEASQIPNRLDLVIDYVNTLDMEEGTDALSTAQGVSAWLSAHGLLAPASADVSAEELERAVELREALRSLMHANNGAQLDPGAWPTLERTARDGDLAVHFDGEGSARLLPGVGGARGGLAGLLAPVAAAVGDGTWRRVKACRAHDCVWAFYDRSRNRSAVWCEMVVCGNRTKVRAYRDRAPRGSG